MTTSLVSPLKMVCKLWGHKGLIISLTKREIQGRYRGSSLDFFWAFLNPILLLLLYTFVFGVIFKSKWTGEVDSNASFALIIFPGLLIFNIFAECVGRAPTLVLENANYVKKVVFPLEILPIISLGAAAYHGLLSLFIWVIAYFMYIGIPHLTILMIPLILLPLCFILLGLTWFLASLGVYLRDIKQFIGPVISGLMFLSPIFYPLTIVPESFRWIFWLNPLTPLISWTRDILFWGVCPNMNEYVLYLAIASTFCYSGLAWFQKTKKGFADVI